jgi:hypothetical protein
MRPVIPAFRANRNLGFHDHARWIPGSVLCTAPE